jgi:acyl-CoA dehydrogenase
VVRDETVASEQGMFLDGLARFVEREVAPLEQANKSLLEDDRVGYLPDGRVAPAVLELSKQVRRAASLAGFYTAALPVEIGGGGVGLEMQFRIWEMLHHRFGPARPLTHWSVAHFATGPNSLLAATHPSVRSVVEGLVSGETSLCFALSEPDAGSDVWAMSTAATRTRSGWRLNGTKQWITNGAHADHSIVFAVTNPDLVARRSGGISAFLVDMSSPGVHVDSVIKLFGHVGGQEAILHFADVELGEDRLIGELHGGFRSAMEVVNQGRIYNCARSVGLGRWSLEKAIEHAGSRVAFSHPIAEYQGIQWLLADSAIELYAARSMSLDCASRLDAGEKCTKELAMSKAFATEAGFRVVDRCMQVLGGMGLTNEMRLTDAWHTIRIVRIAEGSSEIMRRTIARQLLKGDVSF